MLAMQWSQMQAVDDEILINNIIMGKHIIKGSSCSILSSFLLALLLHSVSALADSCKLSCISIDNGCRVCFQVCTTHNSTNYRFASCSQMLTAPPQRSNSSLNASNTFNYTQEECGRYCCDDRLTIFQNPAISSCPTASSEQSKVFIIVITILTVVFVALCCIISGNVRIRERVIKCVCRDKQEKKEEGRIAIADNSLSLSSMVELSGVEGQGASQWREQVCSICLEGRSEVLTQCSHPYHFKCLYEWTSRKLQCPLCKSPRVESVFVFCRSCNKRKAVVRVREVPWVRVGNIGRFECMECRTK